MGKNHIALCVSKSISSNSNSSNSRNNSSPKPTIPARQCKPLQAHNIGSKAVDVEAKQWMLRQSLGWEGKPQMQRQALEGKQSLSKHRQDQLGDLATREQLLCASLGDSTNIHAHPTTNAGCSMINDVASFPPPILASDRSNMRSHGAEYSVQTTIFLCLTISIKGLLHMCMLQHCCVIAVFICTFTSSKKMA